MIIDNARGDKLIPVEDFEGNTFVAFLDISGFKELMKNEETALKALDRLYTSGYNALSNQNDTDNNRIEGFFMSDCGILFIRNLNFNLIAGFCSLLEVIKQINHAMLNSDFMLITSIAYGQFKYRNRIEFLGIDKNPIYGNAYISAYLDTERVNRRIQPGQCRIVRENLPENILSAIEQSLPNNPFNLIKTRENDRLHYYFYWMVNDSVQIERFEKNYKDTYNLKFAGMLQALKNEEPIINDD